MLSRTGSGAVLAGLGAAAVLGVLAPPVLADPTPSPSGSSSSEPSAEPTSPEPAPSDPPASEPPPSDPPTSTPPTSEPSPGDPPSGDPSPSDPPSSEPPSENPKTPVLSVRVSVSKKSVRPGESVTATARVKAAAATARETLLSVNAADVTVKPGSVALGEVGAAGRTARVTVRVPADAGPGTVKLTAKVTAAKAKPVSRTFTFTVVEAPSSGGGSGSGAGSGTSLPTAAVPQVAPLTNSSFQSVPAIRAPQVALPPVSAPQTAPSPEPVTPVAGLRAVPDDGWDTGDLAALQAGWLAALTSTGAIVFVRVRVARRRRDVRRARHLYAGKRLTAARLRTLPPQPSGRVRRRAFSG